jgi:hypothetical protein
MDASDWFAIATICQAARQHTFGGVLGGPVHCRGIAAAIARFSPVRWARLKQPQTISITVPSLAAGSRERRHAKIIDTWRPTGGRPRRARKPTGGAGYRSWADPSRQNSLKSGSTRPSNAGSLFMRASLAPSHSDTRTQAWAYPQYGSQHMERDDRSQLGTWPDQQRLAPQFHQPHEYDFRPGFVRRRGADRPAHRVPAFRRDTASVTFR